MTRQTMRVRPQNKAWDAKQGATTALTVPGLHEDKQKYAPMGGAHSVQAQRLRSHMSKLARELARARTEAQRVRLEKMLQRDVKALLAIQIAYLDAKEKGRKHGSNELTVVPKAPMSLLPRGSVARGFNT